MTKDYDKNRRRLGQLCLVAAICINGVLLLVNLRLSTLEDKLSKKRGDERYFMFNEQRISAQTAKRASLHTSLNQLKMLRRLTKDKISPEENQTLLIDERNFQIEIDAHLRRIVGATYLQANDPPPGQHPDKMFSSKSDKELVLLLPKYRDQAYEYAKTLKNEMVDLMDAISFRKKVHSIGLVISMLVLIVGNLLLFALNKPKRI